MPPLDHRTIVLLSALGFCCSVAVAGCGDDDEEPSGNGDEITDDGEETRHGLTSEQAGETLVKVGDTEITVGEFADRLADQSPYLRARYNSPERRREFLENMIRFELLAAEAERRELDDLPEVQRTVKQVMIQQMMKDLFEERIRLADITDEEIRTFYEEHSSEFNKPEQVRASHILMTDRAAAQRVLEEILADPQDISLFRRLADEHNQDEETQGLRRGDLRFFSEDGTRNAAAPRTDDTEDPVPAPIAAAAFSIERIGGVHPELVETPAGFHIVKLTGRRAALRRSLEEARRPIQNRLWREKRETAVEDFVRRLRTQANVQENDDALDSVQVDVPTDPATGQPPTLPPNHPTGAR